MIRIGVIGTAGRKDDADRLNQSIYDQMYGTLLHDLSHWSGATITLVSGGAAWADHLAVRAFLDQLVPNLELHLPASFKSSKYFETTDKMSPGRIANWYHQRMSHKTNTNSLIQLQRALDKGAVTTVSAGFHQRNILVGNVDILIAFTFGTKSSTGQSSAGEAGLKDGGTAHTWDHSDASLKIHHNLHELL
jgi:hypothetical protein